MSTLTLSLSRLAQLATEFQRAYEQFVANKFTFENESADQQLLLADVAAYATDILYAEAGLKRLELSASGTPVTVPLADLASLNYGVTLLEQAMGKTTTSNRILR